MATKDQLIWHQEVTIDRLGQLLSQALEPQPVSQLPPIHIHHNSPLHVVVGAKGGDATIQHAFCLEQQLPVLHAHLQEAANALPAEEGRQLLEAGAALGQLAEGADESQVKAVLARTAQAFQDLGDDKSKLSKALKGAKKAGKALQAAGRTYNSIARLVWGTGGAGSPAGEGRVSEAHLPLSTRNLLDRRLLSAIRITPPYVDAEFPLPEQGGQR
jgi:hypothetical protein